MTDHLPLPVLRDLQCAVKDLRFIQAAALVGSRLNNTKDAKAYMRRLQELDTRLGAEIKAKENKEIEACQAIPPTPPSAGSK